MGPGEHFVPRSLVHRQRFAGDVGLVERPLPAHDQAVGCDVVPGPDANGVSHRQILHGHFLFPLGRDPPGLGWREFDERFDGGAGPFGCPGFNDLAEQHEESHHARLLIVARGEGGNDGEGDQLVRAQGAPAQVFKGVPDDGIAEQNGPDHGARIRHRPALLEEPTDDERVDDK